MPEVVWITGAGKGIGRALSLKMAKRGWSVAASARTKGDLQSLVEAAPDGRIHAFPLDITDLAATGTTLEAIEGRLGPIDMAVLNAGTHTPITANNFAVDDVRRLVEINLMGTVHGLAELMPRFMKRRSGHIAVVASVAGYRGLPSSAGYGATKAGLINMCEALKPELELHDVRLSLINPGFVETPLTDKNDFPMPFLISAEEAAESILKGIDGGAFETSFPWRFAFLMKLLRILPDPLFFYLTRKMVRS